MNFNYLRDAQGALGFAISQTAYIEPQVYAIQYPDIQYQFLIPVDTSANEWAKSVTYYSTDKTGRAGWFHSYAKDIHVADIERAKNEIGIEMADIGYRWTIEEIGQAMMIPGMNLSADRAAAALRAYEEFVDDAALRGKAEKSFNGLINYPGITTVTAAADPAAGSVVKWTGGTQPKTADAILADVNSALTGIYTASLQIEMADTILLPIACLTLIGTLRIPNTAISVLDYLTTKNVYTLTTGKPLTIRALRGLDVAGAGPSGRMIAYRRDPSILKMHIPMPHRFLPVFQNGPMVFDVPGIFRIGGLEIRRPGSVRYVDGIL
jgi:hypothetical protein